MGRGARLLTLALSLSILAGFLVRAVELRSPQLSRPYWQDEVSENQVVLGARSTAELRRRSDWLITPNLSYVLKQHFWYRVLPLDERGLRLSSFIYSLLSLVAACALVVGFARRNDYDPWIAAILLVCVLRWVTGHPAGIYYAAEARLYSFVGLMSLLWFGVYFLRPVDHRWLAALSFLFANTHFFAFPLVAGAYFCEAVEAGWRGRWRASALLALTLLGILGAAVLLNAPSWRYMLGHPLAAPQTAPLEVGAAGLGLWSDYFGKFLLLPLGLPLAGVLLVIASDLRRRPPIWKVLFFAVVLLPVLFILIRWSSGYGYRTRYYFPYWGFGVVLIVAFFDAIVGWLRHLRTRFRSPFLRAHAVTLGVALLWIAEPLALLRLPGQIWERRSGLTTWPAPNFSRYYQAYEALKAQGRPFFLFNARKHTNDRPEMYLEHIGAATDQPYRIADAHGIRPGREEALSGLRGFLAAHPDGLVVLDQIELRCPGFERLPVIPQLRIRRIDRCVLVVEGVTEARQLDRLARRVGFVMAPGYFDSV